MKYFVIALLFMNFTPVFAKNKTVNPERKTASNAPDCSLSTVHYKKATSTYGNTILKQWACAAANTVPFEKRDSDPKVKECEQRTVLYKEVGAQNKYCIRLDDAEEKTQEFLYVQIVNGVHTPTHQGTGAPNDDN